MKVVRKRLSFDIEASLTFSVGDRWFAGEPIGNTKFKKHCKYMLEHTEDRKTETVRHFWTLAQ